MEKVFLLGIGRIVCCHYTHVGYFLMPLFNSDSSSVKVHATFPSCGASTAGHIIVRSDLQKSVYKKRGFPMTIMGSQRKGKCTLRATTSISHFFPLLFAFLVWFSRVSGHTLFAARPGTIPNIFTPSWSGSTFQGKEKVWQAGCGRVSRR